MTGPRIGSLCTGYGGLDQAVHAVFGGTTAWVSDIDPGACQILKHRMPSVPNIGNLTATDWVAVEPVDIVCAGYPCQPFSTAGKRKGTADERHIWPFIARALGVLRPRITIFENVGGHLRLGFDTVLADLATLGFDAEWCVVRASEVGAPHPRRRLFIVATAQNADREPCDQRRLTAPGQTEGRRARTDLGRRGGVSAAHADRRGLPQHPERDGGQEDGQPERERGLDPHGHDVQRPNWGDFTPAIHRWEAATGRPAPRATDDRNRLSPAFVEWMMGLQAGWVTEVPGLTRTQQLHALGNDVVPQQAEAAIRLLAGRAAT